MKNLFKITVVAALTAITFQACNDEGKPEDTKVEYKESTEGAKFVKDYATMVHADYAKSLTSAKALQTALKAFTTAPTDATLTAAKKAWIEAREDYSVTEVYRGCNGPIDAEGGEAWAINNEGQMNAWPLNEAYIDYVATKTDYTGKDGIYATGIIQGTDAITKAKLAELNEGGSAEDEAAVSTGWHAIEFLLWGQDEKAPSAFSNATDLSVNTSGGNRAVVDYTTKDGADRRKEFLNAAAELLVDDLQDLTETWKDGGVYNKVFMAMSEKDAVRSAIEGPQFLAAAELSNERMLVPATGDGGIDGCGQEDEHSCFSDNTHRDVYLNAQGIVNVLNKGFVALVTKKDAAQGAKLAAEIKAMWSTIKAIDDKAKSGTPFDMMILAEGKKSEGLVMNGDAALKKLGNVIRESAAKIGLTTAASYE